MANFYSMGYELHITRQENWLDSDPERKISIEEWKNYVANDPEMRLDNYAEATLESGEVLRVDSEGITVWAGYSGNNTAWFDYYEGNVCVKNPDDEIIRKMQEIALRLNARVQGDEGEFYE